MKTSKVYEVRQLKSVLKLLVELPLNWRASTDTTLAAMAEAMMLLGRWDYWVATYEICASICGYSNSITRSRTFT